MGWAKVETSNFFGRFDGKFFLIPENISLVDNLRALPWSKVNVHQPAESTMVTCGSNDKTVVVQYHVNSMNYNRPILYGSSTKRSVLVVVICG